MRADFKTSKPCVAIITASIDSRLARGATSTKSEMPKLAQTIELKPGSLLFVPRGYWHSTEAKGEALALNFTFTAPTWIDLFTTALRSRLSLSPEWRETASGVCDPIRRGTAESYLETLLAGLKEDLPHWQASDILNATEPDL